MDVEPGHLFSCESVEEWNACTLQKGDILETDLPVSADSAEGEGSCAFLVQKVKVTLSGDLAVVAKSLGSEVASIQRDMSAAFNRKRGTLHLCGGRCIYPEAYTLHVGHFRLYNVSNYEAPFITAYTKRAMTKWLDEDLIEVEDQMDELDLTGDSLEESAEEGKRKAREETKKAKERKAKAKDTKKKKEGPAVPPAGEGTGRAGGDGPVDRAALREKLAGLRAKLLGDVGTPLGTPAGREPGRDEDEEARSGESSSRGYSPSPLAEPLQSGTHLQALGTTPGAGDPTRDPKEEKKKTKKKALRDKEEKEGRRQKDAGLLAIKDGTTSSLQRQLVARAADAAQRKKAERRQEKKKSQKMDAPAQLLRILMGKKPRKRKEEDGEKKKKKKKKRSQEKKRGPPDSSGSGSSGGGSSPTPSWGAASSERSGDSESESKELDAPLKRRSKEKPGSVLGLLVEHARQQLDQTAKVSIHQVSKDNPTVGVKLTSYFSIVVRPRLGAVTAPVRELHLLASAMDLLRQGDLDILGDLLASRFMSVHQSIIDGSWMTAKHMELMPLEEESAAGNAIILQARKHARLASRLHNQDFWTSNPGPRGRGGRGKGQQWGDNSWQGGDNKGRGKKGAKGKGKNKNSWQNYQGSEGDVSNKNKEKVPEKYGSLVSQRVRWQTPCLSLLN